jgi:hypothetical protein
MMPPPISLDSQTQVAHVSSLDANLQLAIRYGTGASIEQISADGRRIAMGGQGGWTGIRAGEWFSSSLAGSSSAVAGARKLTITGIAFGDVKETWTFTPKPKSIEWRIQRSVPIGFQEDLAQPAFTFADLSTWTGAILGTGGVAWTKLFDTPGATYALHTDLARLWNKTSGLCLELSCKPANGVRFTRETSGEFTVAFQPNPRPLVPKHGQARYLRDRQDIWSPTATSDLDVTLTIKAHDYKELYDRGDLKGIDGNAVREIANTIGRIGVVDDKIIGTNGWYSGYAVLHEPWISLIGLAVDDPHYTRNMAATLDYQRQHAIGADGMVKSRWAYGPYDAQPGTYDERGFYECQWGRLMDTQPSFVINVAEQFDLSGDRKWLQRQKRACESALEYLLRRDSNGNGLVEVANDTRADHKASDWLDTIWASHETAFVNAQMYRALVLWADAEDLLGDKPNATAYRERAEKLRKAFDQAFWDEKNQWYAYWREKEGSLHGNNLTIPVNFMAIGYGLCRDKRKVAAVLDKIEEEMTKQNLFCWPSAIYPFTPDETNDQPFPRYENGDIFMAWAELGIRCYAGYRPAVAMKYIKNVLERYSKDGLAFQRYLRKDQTGAGDDILANNCSAVVGLYRDIYGIQPKHDRLFLDPHLTTELNGTVAKLRGLSFQLSKGKYGVTSGQISVLSHEAFGVAFREDGVDCFRGVSDPAWLSLTAPKGALNVRLTGVNKGTFQLSHGGKLRVSLRPARKLLVDGHTIAGITQSDGRAIFEVTTKPNLSQTFELR